MFFLQDLLVQYKLALASLGKSPPKEVLVTDYVGKLLAKWMSSVSHVDDAIVCLIKELREEQRRLLASVDQSTDDVARLSINKMANCSHSKFWSQSKGNKKANVLEAQEVWGQSKLLYPTMLL